MKRSNKQEPQAEVKREYGTMESFSVLRAYEGRDTVFFTGVLNGVTIYNMRVVTNRNGEDFVAFPSEKGKDGKYYNVAYFALSPDDTAVIIECVEDWLEKNSK